MEFDDLISRAATIDAVENLASSMSVCINVDEYNGMRDMKYRALKAIKECSSAQPMMTKGSDLINRGDAILAVYKRIKQLGMENNADVLSIRQSIQDLPSIQPEPLTDKEQRIFLSAMEREEIVCKQYDDKHRNCREPYKDSLVSVCRNIVRKVKGALWTT